MQCSLKTLIHSKTDEGESTSQSLYAFWSTLSYPATALICNLNANCLLGFFIHFTCCQVTKYQAKSVFKKVIRMLGLETTIYMTHSFDNEAVSSAFDSILSQKDIAGSGRWKYRCMYGYIQT